MLVSLGQSVPERSILNAEKTKREPDEQ